MADKFKDLSDLRVELSTANAEIARLKGLLAEQWQPVNLEDGLWKGILYSFQDGQGVYTDSLPEGWCICRKVSAPVMKWTTETPTKPGWYWVCDTEWKNLLRVNNEQGEYQGWVWSEEYVHVAWVDEDEHGQLTVHGDIRDFSVDDSNFTHWIGPLQQPQKPVAEAE